MLRNFARMLPACVRSNFSLRRLYRNSATERFRVTVIGAGGGIGQPLSLLLRLNPLVSTLTLYDLKLAKGVAADISHIDRPGITRGFDCEHNLLKALACTDIVVVPAGVPRQPGQSREDLFATNAKVIAQIVDAVGLVAPEVFLAIITNPINSTVPIAAEVLKKRDVYDAKRLFGVTTLDVVRTRKFIADSSYTDPARIKVSVIGGHSGKTIVPLISHAEPEFKGQDEDIQRLTKRVQEAGTEVVEAKGGAGSATLSMAYAAAEFVNSLLIAKSGKKEVREIAFVESCLTAAPYFASEILIGAEGTISAEPLPELSPYENDLMCEAMPALLEDIKKGTEFGQAYQIAEKKSNECECEPQKKEAEPQKKDSKCGEPKKK